MKPRITVGVGDVAVSDDTSKEIVTFSLGSCIGVVLYDPRVKVGGLLHIMLPDSNLNLERATKQPAVFADTGLPILFRSAYALGAKKGRMRVVLVGGSQVMDATGHFNIGKRNYTAVRKIFWRNNVLVDAEDIGGNVNRTVGIDVATGQVWVKTNGMEVKAL
ncbi:chemotaxis protein CheD [Dethiosulfatarculus sandiegensis]|uniref:Probable chemoreceptor glutamine deamidase CheD n=1 Tax=Dethiosulfatarculus sandiegensis TaxID=1429043 RepID=A0A0D2HXP5_9BACT|nr:chemotaxis protein CheD [Dethiosulfatarculus sandiegensis]KIX15073.1 chemotaxis protein CheD [Dethiosulfatarculus sandiegensis]